jgi:hypothetical protein
MNEQCVASAKAWSMIETHNKNEDVIWCFTPHSCGGFQYPAYYCAERGAYINCIDGGEERPTFWMQAPDDPTGGA